MAELGYDFDATTVDPSAPFEIISPGKYVAQIVASEMKVTRNGDGQFLELEHEILEGPAKGRRIWNNLNLQNPSAKTVEIAQRTLSAICHAVGELHIKDSEQLHFKPFLLTVMVEKEGNDRHGVWRNARNKIGGYEPLSAQQRPAAPVARPTVVQQAAPPAQAAKPATPPWRAKQAS